MTLIDNASSKPSREPDDQVTKTPTLRAKRAGPDHSMDNLPDIIAGTANGFLAKGKFIDAGGVSNSLMLNTLASALRPKASMGGRAGTISAMLAGVTRRGDSKQAEVQLAHLPTIDCVRLQRDLHEPTLQRGEL
jgi:hypothetical protein